MATLICFQAFIFCRVGALPEVLREGRHKALPLQVDSLSVILSAGKDLRSRNIER